MANFGDRIIVLIDMDCFFCQVEAKLQPEYKGKPMAVVQYNLWRQGGIIAVNYEAREFGVTRHMRGDEAKEKCPEIVLAIVPSLRGKADTSRYRTAGRSVIEVLKNHCSKIERASVDEAYLDITQLVDERMSKEFNNLQDLDEKLNTTYIVGYSDVSINDEEQRKEGLREWLKHSMDENDIQSQRLAMASLIVEEIRADVFQKTEYRCSAGISYNKILAKLACGLHKPNRQTVLPSAAVPTLFSTLPVKKVRNLGGKFGDIVIESLRCNVMSDLLQYSLQHLQNRFDEKTGLWLYNIARGIDNEPVTTRLVPKSIGACKRFPGKQVLTTAENIKHWLGELAAEVCERLEQDSEENERRATLLTLSYQFQQNNTTVSQSKSITLNSYKHEKVVSQCIDVISKIPHPIAFLGLSAAKFVQVKGSEHFKNFFKIDKCDSSSNSICKKSNINESQSTSVYETQDKMEMKNETKTSKDENMKENEVSVKVDNENVSEDIPETEPVKIKKIHSFFKLVNNIPSPKSVKENEEKKVLNDSEKLKKSYFANILKDNPIIKEEVNENSINSSDATECQVANSTIEDETSVMNHSVENNEENVSVQLKEIFPDLDNIDPEILSCLPDYLQKEAALLMKTEKTNKKSSPKIVKSKVTKAKNEKGRKSEGKSIESFFIKTRSSTECDDNYVKCSKCGQLICIEKINEHQDYHVAQSLQMDMNRLETSDEMSNKRKPSSLESSPKKKIANESQCDFAAEKTLLSFFR